MNKSHWRSIRTVF